MAEDRLKNINEEILRSLDGKKVRVHANGFIMEGSMEGDCVLRYEGYRGLYVMVPARWNDTKVSDMILKTLNDHITREKPRLDIDLRDELVDKFKKQIDELYYRAGTISCYGIKKIEIRTSDKNEITGMSVFYENAQIEIIVLSRQ